MIIMARSVPVCKCPTSFVLSKALLPAEALMIHTGNTETIKPLSLIRAQENKIRINYIVPGNPYRVRIPL
jgi:hypothetical protein